MLEEQKITFNDFMLDYKHGVYIFTDDSCDVCAKYKNSIDHINNPNLYFVDVITRQDKDALYEITGKSSTPLTVVFKDNEIEFCQLGQLFDRQLATVFKLLDTFGDTRLSDTEKLNRIKQYNERCILTYYVFPPDTPADIRKSLIDYSAPKFNELPIDVESICSNLPDEQRYRIFSAQMNTAKLVILKDENTTTFNPFAQRIITGYMTKVKNSQFEIRNIKDILNASDYPNNQ